MDFTFTPEQDEAAALAAKILEDRATNERMKAVEAEGSRFDRELWAELGSAGLLGLALPEDHDGAGLGLVELCRILVEVGRTVAPVPLAAHGPAARCSPSSAATSSRTSGCRVPRPGELVLTAAVAEDRAFAPERPTTRRDRDAEGSGSPAPRPSSRRAPSPPPSSCPRRPPTGVAVFLVEPGDEGVTVTPQQLSDGDEVARLDLAGVAVSTARQVGPADGSAARRLRHLLLRRRRGRAARHHRGRAGAHRGVRQDPRAVRAADRHVPGGLAAARRRLHRHARPAADALAGRVAPRRGPARGHRGRDRQALGRRRRPPDRAHHRARPRRRGHRPGRRGPPLLHRRQAVRVPARRRHRAGPQHRQDARGRAGLGRLSGRDHAAAAARARRGRRRRVLYGDMSWTWREHRRGRRGRGGRASSRSPTRSGPLHVGVLLGNTPDMLRSMAAAGARRLRAGRPQHDPARGRAARRRTPRGLPAGPGQRRARQLLDGLDLAGVRSSTWTPPSGPSGWRPRVR